MKRSTIPAIAHVAILLLVLLLGAGCTQAISRPSRGPGETPGPILSEPTPRQFLIDHVGEDYFRAHYVLAQVESTAPNLIKTTYLYTYQSYVTDYQFTLLFNTSTQAVSDEEVSVILLEPQAFNMSRDEAIDIALENGLQPTTAPYEVSLSLGPTTQNRFAWHVVNPGASATLEAPEPIIRVIVDVEDGEVYAVERIEPMKAH